MKKSRAFNTWAAVHHCVDIQLQKLALTHSSVRWSHSLNSCFFLLNRMLCDSAQWNHLCTVLCTYSQDIFQIPVQAFEGALTSAEKNVEWIGKIVIVFSSLMQQGTIGISFEVCMCNVFFQDWRYVYKVILWVHSLLIYNIFSSLNQWYWNNKNILIKMIKWSYILTKWK